MTDKELRKLSRADFLELLIIERQEIDRLLEEYDRIMQDLDGINERITDACTKLTEARNLLQSRFLMKDHGTEEKNGIR